jgi:hypothetical protein
MKDDAQLNELITVNGFLRRLRTWLILEVSQGDPSPNTLRSYLGSVKSYLLWCEASGGI